MYFLSIWSFAHSSFFLDCMYRLAIIIEFPINNGLSLSYYNWLIGGPLFLFKACFGSVYKSFKYKLIEVSGGCVYCLWVSRYVDKKWLENAYKLYINKSKHRRSGCDDQCAWLLISWQLKWSRLIFVNLKRFFVHKNDAVSP